MLSKINRALTVAMMLVLFIGVAGALQETQPGSHHPAREHERSGVGPMPDLQDGGARQLAGWGRV